MTNSKKIVGVLDILGRQGGSVVRSLLQNPEFQVRCITEEPDSTDATFFKSQGAEVFEAAINDKKKLVDAFNDCWGLFINYPVLGEDADTTRKVARDIFLAAGVSRMDVEEGLMKENGGVKHIVLSSEPHCYHFSNKTIRVDYLDVKGETSDWATIYQPTYFLSVTPIFPGWAMEDFGDPYMNALMGGSPFKKDDEGYYTFRTPSWGGDQQVPWVHMGDDFGDLVHGIFLDPVRWNIRPVQAVGDPMSFEDLTSLLTTVSGLKARHIPCDLPIPDTSDPHYYKDRRTGRRYAAEGKVKHPGTMHGDFFAYIQARDGEYFGYGPTENRTASQLKKAAFKAKGGKGQETLCTFKEFLERNRQESQ